MFCTSLYFFIKENRISAMIRYHTESNDILLTRNLPIGSGVRQWNHPLITSLHNLWAKLHDRTRGQFERNVTWFCFCFNLVRSHVQCCYCSIACWRGWEGGGFLLKLDVQGQRCGKILDVDGKEWWGVLKIRQFSWTSYVYCP